MKVAGTDQQVALNQYKNERVEQQAVQQVAQQDSKQAESAPKPQQSSGDKLNVSQTADQLNKASSSSQVPEQFRADKVAELKSQIDAGQYKVSGADVAQKMLDRMSRPFTN